MTLSKHERDSLQNENSKYFLLVRRIINELDPVGLVKNGAPEDEHDSLTGKILLMMINNEMDEVKQFIIDAYEWYGSGVECIAEEYKENFNKKIEIAVNKLNELYKEFKQKI